MEVRFTYYSGGKQGVQRRSISLPKPAGSFTISDFLAYLARNSGVDVVEVRSYLEQDDLRRTVLITRNGRNIHSLEGMDTPIRDGDNVSILPVVAGGCSASGRAQGVRDFVTRIKPSPKTDCHSWPRRNRR